MCASADVPQSLLFLPLESKRQYHRSPIKYVNYAVGISLVERFV